jgi:hypothetical protein
MRIKLRIIFIKINHQQLKNMRKHGYNKIKINNNKDKKNNFKFRKINNKKKIMKIMMFKRCMEQKRKKFLRNNNILKI